MVSTSALGRLPRVRERSSPKTDDGLPEELLRRAIEARRSGAALAGATGGAALTPAAEAITRLAAGTTTIVMDAAAGDETAAIDARALTAGAAVVLSNKAPLALPTSNPLATELWGAAGPSGSVRYEATCGAGLPVVSTLRSLLDTGDETIEIQGVLSGTLATIFAEVADGQPFATAVRGAKEQGFTEPDPRDDLSGLDVARKALILARTIGRPVDLTDIAVESLVPSALADVTIDEFLDRIETLNEDVASRAAAAKQQGRVLKYVATVAPTGSLSVGVRDVPATGVLGSIHGPENVVSIRTRRYDAHPLTVVGPGAGPAVTAAGMLGDALALAAGSFGSRGQQTVGSPPWPAA